MIPEDEKNQRTCNIPTDIEKYFPWAYFYGSTRQDGCGCGIVLFLNEEHSFKMKIGLGRGTNNYES